MLRRRIGDCFRAAANKIDPPRYVVQLVHAGEWPDNPTTSWGTGNVVKAPANVTVPESRIAMFLADQLRKWWR